MRAYLCLPPLTAALLLAGCNSVYTSVSKLPLKEPTASLPAPGIPYRLPAGLVTLKLSFAESGTATDKRLAPTFEVATSHYPDRSSPFLLLPSHNGFFDTHHVITVADGLLSTLSTTETSKAKEAILSLAQTGIDLAKLKASPLNFNAQSDAETSAADIFLNDSPHPTDAEVAYALASALGSKLTVNLAPAAAAPADLPLGSAGLLSLKNSLSPEGDSKCSTNNENPNLTALEGLTPGIYTRAVRAYRADAMLVLDLTALHKLRLQAHEKALRALDADESQQKADTGVRDLELKRAQTEFKAVQKHWLALQERTSALDLDLARHDLPDELRKIRSASREEAAKSLTATKTIADAAAAKLSVLERSKAQATASAFKLDQQRGLLISRRDRYKTTSAAPTHTTVALHTSSTVVSLPDPETLIRVPITRSGFGVTKNTLEFKAGILTKYDSDQTSSIAGFAAIPAGIVNAFAKALVAPSSTSPTAATGTTATTTPAAPVTTTNTTTPTGAAATTTPAASSTTTPR